MSAATNPEPPLCEKCGERHYGRTHPFRAIKHKSGAAKSADSAVGGTVAITKGAPMTSDAARVLDECEREIRMLRIRLREGT